MTIIVTKKRMGGGGGNGVKKEVNGIGLLIRIFIILSLYFYWTFTLLFKDRVLS